MSLPYLDVIGEDYRCEWALDNVVIEFAGLHEARGGELRALLTVYSTVSGKPALLHQADFNLNATRTRQELVKALSTRTNGEAAPNIDWPRIIEDGCFTVREHWRNGNPPIYLPEHVRRAGPRFLLEPYIEWGGPTILFAMGGTGKSIFALALCVCISADRDLLGFHPSNRFRVAYLDWETDSDTHQERLEALCKGAEVPLSEAWVYHFPMRASLAESAPSLRRQFVKLGIGFVVVDSLGPARGGEPESADSTLRLFNAARTFNLPWLGIDHMTKNGGNGQSTPFGSVYTHNSARSTWAMEQAENEPEDKEVILLHNRKRNNGKPLGTRAYETQFLSGDMDELISVSYTPRDTKTLSTQFARYSLAAQIHTVITEHGPSRVSEILMRLEERGVQSTASAVTNALNRGETLFSRQDSYTPAVWGLLSHAQL